MIDFEKLKMIYKFSRTLTLSDIQVLLTAAKTKSYQPGEYLISDGAVKKEVFLIRKGLVRAFKINEKGEE